MEKKNLSIGSSQEIRLITEENKAGIVKLKGQNLNGSRPAGTVEVFGAELPPDIEFYVPPNSRLSFFSWGGCILEIKGGVSQVYPGKNMAMHHYATIAATLNSTRELAMVTRGAEPPPRVLVCGAPSSGKSSICQLLTNYAFRAGWNPIFVQLDPRGATDKQQLNFPIGTVGAKIIKKIGLSGLRPMSQFNTDGGDPNPEDFELPFEVNTGEETFCLFFGKKKPEDSVSLYRAMLRNLGSLVESRLGRAATNLHGEALLKIISGSVMDCPPQLPVELLLELLENFKVTHVVVVDDASLKHSLSSSLVDSSIQIFGLPKAEGVVSVSSDRILQDAVSEIMGYFNQKTQVVLKFLVPSETTIGTLDVNAAPLSALPIGHKLPEESIIFYPLTTSPLRLVNSVVATSFNEPLPNGISIGYVEHIGLIKAVDVISENPLRYFLHVAFPAELPVDTVTPQQVYIGVSCNPTT